MKKEKIIKMVIIIIAIIAIIAAIYCIYRVSILVMYRDYDIREANHFDVTTEEAAEFMKDKIIPDGSFFLYSKYEGKKEKVELYRSLNSFVEYLPELIKDTHDLKDEALEKYFDDNKEDIYEKLGITEQDKFIQVVKYIRINSSDFNSFKNAKIDSYSIKTNSNSTIFLVNFIFEDENEPLLMKVYFY
nr:hypothetical protein [Clostridia bacterium]